MGRLGEVKGCTPELLARSPAYDSSAVLGLAGHYRLVLIDTAAGWLELNRLSGTFGHEDILTLWKTDSLHRHSRVNLISRQRTPANQPIVGQLGGFEKAGFTPDLPQVTLNDRGLDYLTVVFSPNWMSDGDGATIWSLPISKEGTWGFGGYFSEGAYTVPSDADGNPLGQRAGFHCAIRVK
jgi:hypothetical protein